MFICSIQQQQREHPAKRKVMSPESRSAPTFFEAFLVWLGVGLLSFGGPAGQIALMHKMLVEERRWISNAHFLQALNYCHLLPGPEAQQLAIYIGWLLHRTPGGLVAGTLFVVPGFFVILLLSFLYAVYRHIPAVDALFYGLKPAVLAIVISAVLRVGSKTLTNKFSILLAAAAFMALFAFKIPFPIVVLGAGVLGWLRSRVLSKSAAVAQQASEEEDLAYHREAPSLKRSLRVCAVWMTLWFTPVLALAVTLGSGDVFTQIGVFFSKMAAVSFGGAYAVLSYVAQQAVENYAWLKPDDMINGLAMAETTPGPLILVLQFVGFMAAYASPGALSPVLAGILGSILTVWVTFVPCFFWIFLGAPYMELVRNSRSLSAALAGITASVVGVLMNLFFWFGLHTLFSRIDIWRGPLGLELPLPAPASLDAAALVLTIAAVTATVRFKMGMVRVLAGCAFVGWIYHFVLR